MSEPILKALIQLFALISDVHNNAKTTGRERDIVKLFLSRQLNSEMVSRYLKMFDEYMLLYSSEDIIKGSMKDRKRTSLTAMRILAICEKINEELHQKQKIYVIVQLIDYILFGAEITENELDFLDTVSAAFNISDTDYKNIKSFILNSVDEVPEKNRVLIIDSKDECKQEGVKHLKKENIKGIISFLYIAGTNTYILRYSGKEDLFLNGQNVFPGQTYTFDHGSTIRSPGVNTIYYNDVSTVLTEETFKLKVCLDATDISLRYKNSENGIHELSFHEESGTLAGILGGSGVGKSTLLNVLSGISEPQSGQVLINGYSLYSGKEKDNLKGVIGFVPQDDLLIEELTVYQNLYFSARMCLDNLEENELEEAVNRTLRELDLDETRNLKVGNPLNKIISGGQRKRLNIALELIREPTILFVDEPTSGLSSVDSEIVLNLLKELTYRGKLVIINIHQPGSDIYKMFDKVMVIDRGGYQIFYGNPTEAIVYFKTQSSHANADEDRCSACGNVNPDQLLQIIEAKVVNEYGKPTHIRKTSPKEWAERFQKDVDENKIKTQHKKRELPENYYSIPGFLKQSKVYFIRDILSKLANKQYVLISLLGAPLLALLLAHFTKYEAGGYYIFSENENLPAYLFMCVITSLFLGLIISAEEIVRDRRILKRESFLNLSWFSYLNSKVMIMFLISAIQTISFILIGNLILEIRGMTLPYWIILFSTSCFANMLGLNISSAFNSVIAIYILIPFILIPQLLFSGVLVKFDRLHKSNLSSYEYVPIIGDMMAARWSFEALAVEQFKNNKYEKNVFKYRISEKQNYYYAINLINEKLEDELSSCGNYLDSINFRGSVEESFGRLKFHIAELAELAKIDPGQWKDSLDVEKFNPDVEKAAVIFLDSLEKHFMHISKQATSLIEAVNDSLVNAIGAEGRIKLMGDYENEKLKVIVLGEDNLDISLKTPKKFIQKLNPGYMKPVSRYGRAHFYAPYKQIGNIPIDTFRFNALVLWLVTFTLYITLYYSLLQKAVSFFESLRVTKSE